MTKQEHLELNKWQLEILDALKKAQTCPDSAGARVLIVEAAKNLQFLGENLHGGIIDMEDGKEISTGDYLCGIARLLVRDEVAEHLPKVIGYMETLVTSHNQHLARMPDDN